jgi:HD-like signal output (HDOD) protein
LPGIAGRGARKRCVHDRLTTKRPQNCANSGLMSIEDTEQKIIRQLESGYALPPLSALAVKLLELASDEDASIEQMVMLVEKDPSLTVRLLNLANSSSFGTGRPAATLSAAVMRLGFNQIKLMALSISLRGAFPMGRVEQFDYEMFWRVSLYRALIAKGLARRSGAVHPEEAFLSAMILEIGLPILFDLFIKGRSGRFELDLEPLGELLANERAAYGIDHRQVGAAALRYWRFPDHIVACQRLYGQAARLPGNSVLCVLCDLARLFSKVLCKAPGAFGAFYAEAGSTLRLSHEDIHEIVVETFAEVEAIARGLKLEIDKEKDLMEVMEKANGALVRISRKISQCPAEQVQEDLPSFASIARKEKTVTDTLQAVAHEIRNPLTAVGGFARRLAVSLDPCSQSGKYAKVILEEALRLEQVLSRMPVDLAQDHNLGPNHID